MTKQSLLKRIREFDQKYSIDLKQHVPKKYFNNKIIYGGVIVVLLLAVYALYSAGSFTKYGVDISNKIYYSCPKESLMPCVVNATITKEGEQVEATLFLQPGETYGEVPPAIVKDFGFYVLVIMVSTFGLNHLYYVRKVKNGQN